MFGFKESYFDQMELIECFEEIFEECKKCKNCEC